MFATLGRAMSSATDPRVAQASTAAGGTVTAVRQVRLNGSPAVRYTIRVDMTKAVKRMDLRRLVSTLGGQASALAAIPGMDARTKKQIAKLRRPSDADVAKMRANMLKSVKASS